MSTEYELLIHLPSSAPAEEALAHISDLLDLPVSRDTEGLPRVQGDGLLVYSFVPDELDKPVIQRLFELDTNLTLVFVNLVHDDARQKTLVEQKILRIMLRLAAVQGARAVLIWDYSPDAIILKFEDGQLIFNRDWDGGSSWPEVLEVVPLPRREERLRGRD
jgi:hypothetical protein